MLKSMQAHEQQLAEAAEALNAVTSAHTAETKRIQEAYHERNTESRRVLEELEYLDPAGEAETQPAGELKARYDALQAEIVALKDQGVASIADTRYNDLLKARHPCHGTGPLSVGLARGAC
jgi:hypothetical protein